MSLIGNTNLPLPQSIMPGMIITSQKETALMSGHAFTQSQVYTFSAAQVKDFIYDPTNYVPGETQKQGRILFEIPTMTAMDGPILIEFFADPIITVAGNSLSLPCFNRDASSSITCQLQLSQDPTLSADGTAISQLLIPSSITHFSSASAAVGQSPLPYLMDNNTVLMMRITNQGGDGNEIEIRNYWYEV